MSKRSNATKTLQDEPLCRRPERIAENADSVEGLSARNSPHCLKDGDFVRIKHLKTYRNT